MEVHDAIADPLQRKVHLPLQFPAAGHRPASIIPTHGALAVCLHHRPWQYHQLPLAALGLGQAWLDIDRAWKHGTDEGVSLGLEPGRVDADGSELAMKLAGERRVVERHAADDVPDGPEHEPGRQEQRSQPAVRPGPVLVLQQGQHGCDVAHGGPRAAGSGGASPPSMHAHVYAYVHARAHGIHG